MSPNAYYDGCFTDVDKVRIPLSDRAYFFADAIYEAVLGRHKKAFMLDRHLNRFRKSASLIGLKIPYSDEELTGIFDKLIDGFEGEYFFLYFQLSARCDTRSHARNFSFQPALLATVSDIKSPASVTPAYLVTAKDLRYKLCNVKTVNLLPAVLASTEAELKGADEAVFIKTGTVTECAHSNISILKDGALITHPADNLLLAGTGRAHLLRTCAAFEIPVEERIYTLDELMDADEILITSASALCMRVLDVDGFHVTQRSCILLPFSSSTCYNRVTYKPFSTSFV